MESSEVARRDAYGRLPDAGTRGVFLLDAGYVDAVVQDVRLLLGKVGMRLAAVLNKALGAPP